MSKCTGTKADGTACGSEALQDSEYCRHHQPKSVGPELPKVKQIVRVIADGTPRDGSVSVDELNAYISLWIDLGYKLFDTHYLGRLPEGYTVLYILVHE